MRLHSRHGELRKRVDHEFASGKGVTQGMTLREVTESIRSDGEQALVPFLTAGFPDDATFLRLVQEASLAGCRVIEIGIPFSDPMADGPVIQESSKQALENGMTLARALDLAQTAARRNRTSLVFMSYVNPLLQMGFETFASRAQDAGVAGVIVPDVPLEESEEIRQAFRRRGITLVDLIAPTSNQQRVRSIVKAADGFLYLVSLTGVTGVRTALSRGLGEFVERVRDETPLPLYVGFGVSTPDQARQVAGHADGVIIGSALIRLVQAAGTADEAVQQVGRFLQEVKRAIDEPNGSPEP